MLIVCFWLKGTTGNVVLTKVLNTIIGQFVHKIRVVHI